MKIELRKRESGWTATYSGPGSDEIMALFGTVEIPTLFTAVADAVDVLDSIRRRNPGVAVALTKHQ